MGDEAASRINWLLPVATFIVGATLEAFLQPVSELVVNRIAERSSTPEVIVQAPLEVSTVSQIDDSGVVVGSRPWPVDQIASVLLLNDTGAALQDVQVAISFSPTFGSTPYLSKAQVMTSSLLGRRGAEMDMVSDGEFVIDIPSLPADGVIFGQFYYWEAVTTVVEVRYSDDVIFEVVPPGCSGACENVDFTIPSALDSFFTYAAEECVSEGKIIHCPAPGLESKGDAFEAVAGSAVNLSWDIVFGNERFAPFDPRIVLGRQEPLYSETLRDR